MGVNATHPEYETMLPRWQLVKDVVNSEAKQYISDVDSDDPFRNDKYRENARLTNFTSRTKNGLVGAIFSKATKIDLPESIDYLIEDATGSGITLDRLAQEITGEVLQTGRYGLLVDFPRSEPGLTAAQVQEKDLSAKIIKYTASSIINWQEKNIDGILKLALITLKEDIQDVAEDGFTWVSTVQYRVLSLIEGTYVQTIYDKSNNILETIVPTDFTGATLNEIPFVFIGSEDNDAAVDNIPLIDLAELNIGHLRNSADYEESVHITGQPTLFITTQMSSEEFKSVHPGGIRLGSRVGHNLGAGGSAQLIQALPNSLADEAMKRKEEQAVMIGARLITQSGTNETAEAARIKHSGENSVLSILTRNVSDGILQCIEYVLLFMSTEEMSDDVVFQINDQFFDVKTDPAEVMASIQLFNNGIIALPDVRENLRKTGLIKPERTDDDIDDDLGSLNPLSLGTGSFPDQSNEPEEPNDDEDDSE